MVAATIGTRRAAPGARQAIHQRLRSHAVLLAATGLLLASAPASAQIGQLLSPGPLSRAHASLEGADKCQRCHEPGRRVTPERCLSCHKPIGDRIRAKTGVHRNVAGDCASCHVEHAGVDAELRPLDLKTFNHAEETGFVLDGRHAALSRDCARCHKTRSYLSLTPACARCHADVHKPSLGSDCRACHSTAVAFKEARSRFDHSKAAFQLDGAHRTVTCAKCHVNQVFKGLRFAQCTDCHKSPHRQPMGDACTSCHDNKSWKTQKVDHGRTAFPLRGRHAVVACAKCHTRPPLQAALTFDRCAACHQDPHRGAFKQDCSNCHNETGFGRGTFDHAAGTRFALTGAHARLACSKCHKSAAATSAPPVRVVEFRGLSTSCASCHADVHRAELGKACENCHTTVAFRVTAFTHPRLPEFFAGGHRSVACAGCHAARAPGAPARTGVPVAGWTFKNLPTACASCHRDVHLGQVGSACERCHSVDAAKFAPVRFSHATSVFKLTGRHETVECRKCHKTETGTFPTGAGTAVRLKGVATTCAACHQDVHLGQVGSACERCHSVDAAKFAPVRFSHASSAFKLTGRHETVECRKCHKAETGTFPSGAGTAVRLKGVATGCRSCHQDQHLGQLGSACESCHTPASFKVTSFKHASQATFFLGKHAAQPCSACHKLVESVYPAGRGLAVRYKGLTACASCHQDPHAGSMGSNCDGCHSPEGWVSASRAFHKTSRFNLEGRHLDVPCAKCHLGGAVKGTPNRCYDCHWIRRQDDPYRTRLGSDCETCHRPIGWTAVTWNHGAATGMALSPAHRALGCDSCHVNRRFDAASPLCYSCHAKQYLSTTRPNHQAAGFPTQCEMCHLPSHTSFSQAGILHNAYFPLVGTHATQVCGACHKNNVYKGTPRDCYGCHRANYERTTNPNHLAAGFPTACETCHKNTDTSFGQGRFVHTWFPITSGRHAGRTCAECHQDPNNYKVFTCTTCHTRSNTDREHSGRPGYRYESAACYSCHPTGRGD